MHWAGAVLGGVLLSLASSLVTRVLVSLGVGVVTFAGIDALLDEVRDLVVLEFNALPAEVIAFAGLLKLGVAVSLMLSAFAIRLTLAGLREGNITKMFVGVSQT